MRYFIHKNFINELNSRQNYLYETLSIWCIPFKYNKDFIVLNSIPKNCLDVCFLVGHNYDIKNFILNNDIYEKNIVAITCDGKANFNKLNLRRKKLYLSHQDSNNLAPLFRGKEYGFDFNLTESEILFYRTSKSTPLSLRLDECFTIY